MQTQGSALVNYRNTDVNASADVRDEKKKTQSFSCICACVAFAFHICLSLPKSRSLSWKKTSTVLAQKKLVVAPRPYKNLLSFEKNFSRGRALPLPPSCYTRFYTTGGTHGIVQHGGMETVPKPVSIKCRLQTEDCRLKTPYKTQTDTQTISVKYTINFLYLNLR